jgi:hypothetical protein
MLFYYSTITNTTNKKRQQSRIFAQKRISVLSDKILLYKILNMQKPILDGVNDVKLQEKFSTK